MKSEPCILCLLATKKQFDDAAIIRRKPKVHKNRK